MVCRNCGRELKENWTFCDECGYKINPPSEQGDTVNGVQFGNAFKEKKYILKEPAQLTGMRSLVDAVFAIPKIITGIDMGLFICKDKLVIFQKQNYQNKITAIPYNEIQSFEIDNRLNISAIIKSLVISLIFVIFIALFCRWAMGFIGWAISLAIFLMLSSFVMINMLSAQMNGRIIIKVSDGRVFGFFIKHIKKKKETVKNEFISELNKMVSQTPPLQNISEKQSKIVSGFTKMNWKKAALDVVENIFS